MNQPKAGIDASALIAGSFRKDADDSDDWRMFPAEGGSAVGIKVRPKP